MTIQKGKTEFLMGIDKNEQLIAWFQKQPILEGVAFVGRSNVGKSSVINALFGSQTARVSKTPGRTRQINIFSFEYQDQPGTEPVKFFLFDVPGYGHAEVSKEMSQNWQVLLDTFFQLASDKILLMNIQDARHPLQESDVLFHKYLKDFRLETYLVFNKMDKLKTQSERALLQKKMPDIYKRFKWVKQIYFTSAETKQGMDVMESGLMNFLLRD